MATIDGMRHWLLGIPEGLTESWDLLFKNMQTLSRKFDYRIRVYFIICDEDRQRFGLLAVKRPDAEYSYPSQMLEETDADVHSCIVRTCREDLNAATHVICGHLPVRRLTGTTKGIGYVVFCEETDLLKRSDGRDLKFVHRVDTSTELEETKVPEIEYQKAIAIFWNSLKAENARLAEVIRVAEIRHETEVISEAQAARQRFLACEAIVTDQIPSEVQAKLSDDDDS